MLKLTADEDKELTEEVSLGECGSLDSEGTGTVWMAQTTNEVTHIYLADNLDWRLAYNGDSVGVQQEGTEGWSFDWHMPVLKTK